MLQIIRVKNLDSNVASFQTNSFAVGCTYPVNFFCIISLKCRNSISLEPSFCIGLLNSSLVLVEWRAKARAEKMEAERRIREAMEAPQ